MGLLKLEIKARFVLLELARYLDLIILSFAHTFTDCISRAFAAEWSIFEQAVRAYLDCGNPGGRAQTLLEALQGQFPNSRRTIVLEAMVYEYEGEYKDANDLYDELLNDDPTNSVRCCLLSLNRYYKGVSRSCMSENNTCIAPHRSLTTRARMAYPTEESAGCSRFSLLRRDRGRTKHASFSALSRLSFGFNKSS